MTHTPLGVSVFCHAYAFMVLYLFYYFCKNKYIEPIRPKRIVLGKLFFVIAGFHFLEMVESGVCCKMTRQLVDI